MIKVQPSYSDIVWAQTPDRITLTMPRAGLWSGPGSVVLVSLLWLGVSTGLVAYTRNVLLAASVVRLSIPGLITLLVGAAGCLRTWTLERDATGLTYRRSGLWGTWTRRWPAGDLAVRKAAEKLYGLDVHELGRRLDPFQNLSAHYLLTGMRVAA